MPETNRDTRIPWDKRYEPSEMFDIYVEVGEIKLSDIKTEKTGFAELWVSPCFRSSQIRKECRSKSRRSLFSVIDDIKKLCEDRDICVLIMEDESEYAVGPWSDALCPIVKYLKFIGNVKSVITYTKQTKDEIDAQIRKERAISEFDVLGFELAKNGGVNLFEITDGYVTEKSNAYSDENGKQFINDARCEEYLEFLASK